MKILMFTIMFFAQTTFGASFVADLERQIQNHRNHSDSLQNLISESERKISQLAQEENEQLSQLNEMEKIIETSRILISSVEKQVDSLSIQKKESEKILAQTQENLNKRREIMIGRLQKIYKMGEPSILSIILGANSPSEVMNRIKYMQDLNKYDRSLLDIIRQDEQKLLEQTKIYELESAHLEELLKERLEENRRINVQILNRKKFLDDLRNEKDRWEISINEYKNAQAELSKIVEDLISELSKQIIEEESNFAERKGQLPWAVSGRVISNFGRVVHPEYKTTITNNGIDIEAPNGTPVKSVAAGVIEFVGRMRGYGKLMIINHFGGYLTIYAHLNDNYLEKGARVREGQVIASVGESGSLDGSKLHFEIRHDNIPLNPIEWLRGR